MTQRTITVRGSNRRLTLVSCDLCRTTGHFTISLVEPRTWACPSCVEKIDARSAIAEFDRRQRARWDREKAA